MYDGEDEELIDDPISLMYQEFPEYNMQKFSDMSFVDLDLEDDPIRLILNPKQESIDTEIVDLSSSDDENEEPDPIPRSSYGRKHFILPVTFLDSYRNIKLLKKCKPLSIKIVDCDKHPWYYRYRGAKKSSLNVNCLTLGKNSNILHDVQLEQYDKDTKISENKVINTEALTKVSKSSADGNCLTLGKISNLIQPDIKARNADDDTVILKSEGINVEPVTTNNKFEDDDNKQDQGKKQPMNNCMAYAENEITITDLRSLNAKRKNLKQELDKAKQSKDLSQLDIRRNSGLVGLTVSIKDVETNIEKVTKKKINKKHKKVIEGKSYMQDIGMVLSNLGTSVVPIPEKINNNESNNLAKDCFTNNIALPDLTCKSSDNRDKINNNANSPTRCSLKINCSKILEKAIQLKKSKCCTDKDAHESKTKLDIPRKAKKIFGKDQAVPKLNLKRRPTTENEEFYIIDSNKEPRCYTPKKLKQSQEPQKVEEVVENKFNKKKSPGSHSPIIPCNTINTSSQHKLTPDKSLTAEKQDQNQTCASLPTPRSYHKKLKLKRDSPNTVNKIIPINSECSSTPNDQGVKTSDGSLASYLNAVVVPPAQSPGYTNTPISNKSNTETPKKTVNNLTQSKPTKVKRPKNIVKATANTINANENEIQNRDIATHDVKVNNVCKPSINLMRVYNEQFPENFLKEMRQPLSNTQPNSTTPNKTESDPKTLKTTENNWTVHNQLKSPKNTGINNAIPNRDVVTNDANMDKTPTTAFHYMKKYCDPKQLEEYYKRNMKHHSINTQPDLSNTINNISRIETQVYNHPGNNTVILKQSPAHLQTTQQTPGLPIQTVINHRPLYPAKSMQERPTSFHSSWSFPPPNTNVAYNVPYCSMPNVNMPPGNQMYHPWQRTVPGNHYFPPSPLVVQQQRNCNLIPVKNQAPNDSIIGSTADGELIKKINIGVPASESTIVNDKQKMLDTLNNEILKRDDFIRDMVNSKPIVEKKSAKPCPLSKKAKTYPEPSKGYSPPILPIPPYPKALELLKQKRELHDSLMRQIERMRSVGGSNSTFDNHLSGPVKKLPTTKNRNQNKTKKISVDEYLKRVSKDGEDVYKVPKRQYNKKNVSKNESVDNNQDLGYDSDATMKI